ncbi:MAG: hypothetical protein KJO54_01435 [Gammaproteobacteria bacterium]|nr:hypothetical protein [Gammaproteobacteria bacterium]NNF60470.1 hypothetical protein [Gammaproteobacteria bacterium]
MTDRSDSLIGRAAALPDEISPERDLWPQIASKLGQPEVPAVQQRRWWPQAVAAGVALVALSSAVTWRFATQQDVSTAAVVAAITAPATQYVADAEMLQVRQRLTVALDDSLQRLSPDTRRNVSRNLLEIHESLARIRTALEQDPQNAFLHQLLHSIYRQELDLLTDINKLAAERPQEIQI